MVEEIAVGAASLGHEPFKRFACSPRQHNAERLEDAPDLVGNFDSHSDELGSRPQHRSNCVAIEALNAYLSVPTSSNDLSQSISIVLVGLIYLAAHGCLGVPRIQTHHG
jgi:hypothetical protein